MVVSLQKNLNELEATKLTLKNGNFYVACILEKTSDLTLPHKGFLYLAPVYLFHLHPSLLPSSHMDLLIPHACPSDSAGATPLP